MGRTSIKKISIFTWCYNNGPVNMGQILQCYALQYLCQKAGCNVKVISFRRLDENETKDVIPSKGVKRNSYEKEYKNRNVENQNTKQVINTCKFIHNNINLSEQCYSVEDILEEIEDSDLLLVGSDQLWNPLWIDPVYLLDFETGKKVCVSYATSGLFSESIMRLEDIRYIASKISKFKYVSVREPSGERILSLYSGKQIFNALDPVLMLNQMDCDEISTNYPIEEPYILAFYIGRIDPQKHLIKEVARINDVKTIVYVKMTYYEEQFNELDCMIGIDNVGPGELISLIKKASAICTDSYHAFVLSVIYHKNFYLMNRAYVPLNEVSNERWDSVMEKLGIEKRYSNSRSEIMNLSQIDYEKVENQLNYLREESREWLIKALE